MLMCKHCGQQVHPQDMIYILGPRNIRSMSLNRSIERNAFGSTIDIEVSLHDREQSMVFHTDCFQRVAGAEYMP